MIHAPLRGLEQLDHVSGHSKCSISPNGSRLEHGSWITKPAYVHTFARYLHIICVIAHTDIAPSDSVMGTMAYIYATALTGDIVKLGRTDHHKDRALHGQSYHVDRVVVLGMWHVKDGVAAEFMAHRACSRWHVRGELYRVAVDWLDIVHPLVARVSGILGPCLPVSEWPEYRSRRGSRKPWETREAYRLRVNRT